MAALPLILALVLVGCNDDEPAATPTPSPTPPPAITAPEAVSMSRDAMAALPSFRFELTHETGTTSLAGGLVLTRATGAAVSPDRLSLEAESRFGSAFLKTNAVVIAGDTYMTNPLTEDWSVVPEEDSPFNFLDPPKLVGDILGQVQNPSFAEPPQPGADLVVTGTVPAPAFAALVGDIDDTSTVTVRLTIDPARYLLKLARIEGRLQPADDPATVRVISLSSFGEAISIEPPI